MKTSSNYLAGLLIPLFYLGGCSTAPYKPSGFSEQQITQKLNDLRQTCRKFRQGDYLNIKFYEGAPEIAGKPASGAVTGYFYAYNKMNDTISVASKPLTFADRGEPYPLQYIADIAPAQDTTAQAREPNIVIKAVQNFFTVKEHDYEKALLTQ